MPLSTDGAQRSFRQNVQLAVLLASVAGAVNAAGFFVLATHTSHMTGQVAALGEALATNATEAADTAAWLIVAFVLGAAAAAALLDVAAHWQRGRHVLALALELAVLAAPAGRAARHAGESPPALTQALCFAMGLQNAMVTRISGAIVRTTHLTGVLTDFGIELVHAARWL